MSDKPTPPPTPQPKKQPDPMAAVVAGVRLTRERRSAQEEVERLRADLTVATERVEVFGTEEKRKMAREQDRRALLSGRVILGVLADDPEGWATFWPHLSAALDAASDTDRALFDLPPRPKKPEARQDTEGEKAEGKSEGEPAAKQGTEGEKSGENGQEQPPIPPLNTNQGQPENQEQKKDEKKDENHETATHT